MGLQIKSGVLKRYIEVPGVTEVIIPASIKTISECSSMTSIVLSANISCIAAFIAQKARVAQANAVLCDAMRHTTVTGAKQYPGGRRITSCLLYSFYKTKIAAATILPA